jgi:general secretion pathway protein C
MWVRSITLLVWAGVAATGLFWALKLFVKPAPVPPQAQVAQNGAVARGDLTRLLGVDAPPPVAEVVAPPANDTRFALLGVLSPRAQQASGEAVALIAVDGKPARAYRIGALVDGGNVLQSVSARGANLGPRGGASVIALNIAPPQPAATGQLPPAMSQPGAPPFPGAVPGLPPQQPQGSPPLPQLPPGVPPQILPPEPAVPAAAPPNMVPRGPSLR